MIVLKHEPKTQLSLDVTVRLSQRRSALNCQITMVINFVQMEEAVKQIRKFHEVFRAGFQLAIAHSHTMLVFSLPQPVTWVASVWKASVAPFGRCT